MKKAILVLAIMAISAVTFAQSKKDTTTGTYKGLAMASTAGQLTLGSDKKIKWHGYYLSCQWL